MPRHDRSLFHTSLKIRPAHSIALAVGVTLIAVWSHARESAQRTLEALSNGQVEPTVMVPLDDQLHPLGDVITIGDRKYAVCTLGNGSPWQETASGDDSPVPPHALPHPSSFVALCASVCYWLTQKQRAARTSPQGS